MHNKNECLSDSTYFEIDLSFLLQDIENLHKHAELLLRERHAAYRRFAPIGRLKNDRIRVLREPVACVAPIRYEPLFEQPPTYEEPSANGGISFPELRSNTDRALGPQFPKTGRAFALRDDGLHRPSKQ
jgi:hypothetical protein